MADISQVWVLLAGKAASLASVAEQQKLRVQVAEHLEDAVQKLRHLSSQLACVIFDDQRLLKELKGGAFKQIFCIAVDQAVADDPLLRLAMFDAGARMLAPSMMAAEAALAKVAAVVHDRGVFSCPGCGLEELSENALHLHMQLHHSVDVLKEGPCPICGKKDGNLAVHVHNDHGPPEEREPPHAPFQTFSWCVCRRRDGRFLLVNEPAGISGGRPSFWLPAGRVDRGESLQEACVREALEEAGVRVRVTGLLRLMVDGHGTLRAIFLAEPEDPTAEPKSLPDWESVGAMWVDVKELKKLKESDYRHPDPAELYPQVASGRLKPEPVDTKDFQSLEDLVRRLTLGDLSAEPELNRAWRRVQKSYPASLFQRG